MAISRGYGFTLTGRGDAEQLDAKLISSDYFVVLGANPVIGRTFAPGEDKIGAAPIVLIGEGFWKRKFEAAPTVLGKASRWTARTTPSWESYPKQSIYIVMPIRRTCMPRLGSGAIRYFPTATPDWVFMVWAVSKAG